MEKLFNNITKISFIAFIFYINIIIIYSILACLSRKFNALSSIFSFSIDSIIDSQIEKYSFKIVLNELDFFNIALLD